MHAFDAINIAPGYLVEPPIIVIFPESLLLPYLFLFGINFSAFSSIRNLGTYEFGILFIPISKLIISFAYFWVFKFTQEVFIAVNERVLSAIITFLLFNLYADSDNPDGKSIEITYLLDLFIECIIFCKSEFNGLFNPVPNMQSMIKSQSSINFSNELSK